MRMPLFTAFTHNAARRLRQWRQLTVVLCAVACLVASSTVGAGTLRVNSVQDTHEDGRLTLREAIAQSSAGDTIVFDVAEVLLTQGELQIAHDLVLEGGGAGAVEIKRNTVDPTPNFRIFNVIAGKVTMTNLKIANGMEAPSAADVPAHGGGIFNAGNLVLQRCTFDSNRALGASGGTTPPLSAAGAARGGDIYNKGTATIDECTFAGSDVAGGSGASPGGTGGLGEGGAIYNAGSMTIRRSFLKGSARGGAGAAGAPLTVNGGLGGTARGGGCFNNGQMLVTNSTVTNSGAGGGWGGAPAVGGTGGNGGDAQGGAFFNAAALTLVNATIHDNSSRGGGPGFGSTGATMGTMDPRGVVVSAREPAHR
jgi:hypothetical protein